MSLGIWSLISYLDFFYVTERPRTIADLTHLKSNPLLALSSVIYFFSMAGIPPFIGFLAKYCIFLSTVHVSFYTVSVTIIIINVVSTYYERKVHCALAE